MESSASTLDLARLAETRVEDINGIDVRLGDLWQGPEVRGPAVLVWLRHYG
jgi:hypothetical protein